MAKPVTWSEAVKLSHPQDQRGHDLYPSPMAAVEALLRVERIPSLVWEPAAGRGAIAQVLRDAGHTVVCSDIVERCFPLDLVGDFLEHQSAPSGAECIVTNPPYNRKLLNEFVAHALDLAPQVMMLVRLSFLESTGRSEILESRGLVRVHVFRERLQGMHRDGWTGKKASGQIAYCWCIWQRGYLGPVIQDRISIHPPTGNGQTGSETAPKPEKWIIPMTKVAPTLTPIEPLAAPSTTAPVLAPDPFDLTNLRLASNFSETSGVKKLLRTIPVRKPGKQDFVRVHPDASYRENFAMIELKEDRELYLISGADLTAELSAESTNLTLHTAINRQGVVFLWPVPLPRPDGREMLWHSSAREAAAEAITSWVRVSANMSLGAYELTTAEAITTEPQWPPYSFQELLRIAFRDRLVTDLSHPVIKRLRGLA